MPVRQAVADELARIASRRTTVTYEALAAKFPQIAGPSDPKLMKILDEIAAEDFAAGRLCRSAIVHSRLRNEPGRRFFQNATTIGAPHPSQAEDEFLFDTIQRLHEPDCIPTTDFSKPAKGKKAKRRPRHVSPYRLMNMVTNGNTGKERLPSSITT